MLPPFPSKNFYQEASQDMAGLLTGLRGYDQRIAACLVSMRWKRQRSRDIGSGNAAFFAVGERRMREGSGDRRQPEEPAHG